MYHKSELRLNREKAMETTLVALAFVGVLSGLILVGMMGTLYFYTRGALEFSRYRQAKGLRAVTARSVPYQVSVDVGQSEINLGLSNNAETRYARGSMLVTALVLLPVIVVVVSALGASTH